MANNFRYKQMSMLNDENSSNNNNDYSESDSIEKNNSNKNFAIKTVKV